MASLSDEFTLESVKDFMVSRGGRVTNHELVNHFKTYLTNPACKETARNKFKQYVNTLANISNEGGEKYLVLKRKYRVGTPLDDEYVTPAQSPSGPAFTTPNQFNVYGSPQLSSPLSPGTPPAPPLPARATPPYRAPPPYRPPPPATPSHQGYLPPEDLKFSERRYDGSPQHFNGRSETRYHGDIPVYHPGSEPRYPPVADSRFSEARYPYEEPADLGIPPPPQTMRSASSLSSLSSSVSYGGSSTPHSPAPPYGGYGNAPPLAPLSASRPKSLSLHQMSSPSEDGDSQSMSATTVSSSSTPSSEEPPPPVPPRRRQADNKENLRPAPDGEEGAKIGMGDGNSEDGAGEGTGEERKTSVSVREQTQKFNKLASESQLPSSSSRASSKSNRSSRSDKDDDDSTSILSYGPEGQEWQIAVAKSDFSEILRLLKIHPSLARHKVCCWSDVAWWWIAVVPAPGSAQGKPDWLRTGRSGSTHSPPLPSLSIRLQAAAAE
ncbi:uncharacterized protein LOC135089385 isoform X1 [Scylla paramamosain]|uniref:uncharacterized protein LOC135089385 isoform X1 n=1 Tax=Scylla paramamosain TaxID=85552 RepID=UPI003082F4F8